MGWHASVLLHGANVHCSGDGCSPRAAWGWWVGELAGSSKKQPEKGNPHTGLLPPANPQTDTQTPKRPNTPTP